MLFKKKKDEVKGKTAERTLNGQRRKRKWDLGSGKWEEGGGRWTEGVPTAREGAEAECQTKVRGWAHVSGCTQWVTCVQFATYFVFFFP